MQACRKHTISLRRQESLYELPGAGSQWRLPQIAQGLSATSGHPGSPVVTGLIQ